MIANEFKEFLFAINYDVNYKFALNVCVCLSSD